MTRHLPAIAFVAAVAMAAFGSGALLTALNWFPIPQLRDGLRTIRVAYAEYSGPTNFGEFDTPEKFGATPRTAIPPDEVAGRRFRRWAQDEMANERLLVFGGYNQYREACPEHGCLGVVIDRRGTILHGYPFRPDELFSSRKELAGTSLPREAPLADPETLFLRPVDLHAYPNGDLLVVFMTRAEAGVFPYAGGVARVDRDGHVRWRRYDYSHHWGSLLDGDQAIVPAYDLGHAPIRPQLRCRGGRPYLDKVHLLDGEGALVREISVIAALLASPMSAMVFQTDDGCDPLHVNYVDVIGSDAGPGLTAGDLVVSLRSLGAFAVLDRKSGAVERIYRGTFLQQHAVRHLKGSRFLLFDNLGGDKLGGPSRLLEVDLEGVERTVFPSPAAPLEDRAHFSRFHGHVDVSRDRRRALVSFTDAGRGFEIELSTGRVLFAYDNVHDLRGVKAAPEGLRATAARASLYGMRYLRDDRLP